MCRQIEINGQRFELKSLDGKLWCSDIADVLLNKRQREAKDKSCKVPPRYLKVMPELNYPEETDLYSLGGLPS